MGEELYMNLANRLIKWAILMRRAFAG